MNKNKHKTKRYNYYIAILLALFFMLPYGYVKAEPSASPTTNDQADVDVVDDEDSNTYQFLPGVDVYIPSKVDDQTGLISTAFSSSMLKEGDNSPLVASIQTRLMELEYFENDRVTNYFGPITKFAIQLFQRSHDLEVDGIAGEETLDLLFSDEAKVYTIYPGNMGLDIKNMQKRLKELGYYSGSADGTYGKGTEKSVRAFQKRNGLVVDGKIGTQSRDILFSPNAKSAPKAAPSSSSSGGSSGGSGAETFVSIALAQRGDPYVWGATGPGSFDCSGLVYYCLNHAGKRMPRYNAAGFSQVSSWQRISSVSGLRRGDIMFFRSSSSSRVSHTAIYLGGGTFVHASSGNGRACLLVA